VKGKKNEIRYNNMCTFFCNLEKNVALTVSCSGPTWDEVEQRVGQDQSEGV
jgi:hypothetical protein